MLELIVDSSLGLWRSNFAQYVSVGVYVGIYRKGTVVPLWDVLFALATASSLSRPLVLYICPVISLIFLIIIIDCLLRIPTLTVELSLRWVKPL